MWKIIEIVGLVGWLIGAICLVGYLWQRDVNRYRQQQQEDRRAKGADSTDMKK